MSSRRRIKPFPIGERLRKIRTDKGLSLDALSERSGLDKGHLSLLERDKVRPQLDTLMTLVAALGIYVTDLLPPVPIHEGPPPKTLFTEETRPKRRRRTPEWADAKTLTWVAELADRQAGQHELQALRCSSGTVEEAEHRGAAIALRDLGKKLRRRARDHEERADRLGEVAS